jgi:hypothetical protein
MPTPRPMSSSGVPAAFKGKGKRLSPKQLGSLARDLACARSTPQAGRIKARLLRGFYGI